MGFWDNAVLEQAEEKKGFDPVPEGTYNAILVDSEIKDTKSGGHYVNAKFELNGNPQLDGRVVFAKFNVNNSNSTAVAIGLGQIKELAQAVKKPEYYESLKQSADWEDARERLNGLFDALGNVPVEIKVVVKKDEKFGDSNDIKRFKTPSGMTAPVATPAPAKGKRPF